MADSINCFTNLLRSMKIPRTCFFFTNKLFDMGYRVINCMVSRMLYSKSKLIFIKYFL